MDATAKSLQSLPSKHPVMIPETHRESQWHEDMNIHQVDN